MLRAAYDLFWSDPLTLDRHLDGIERVYRGVLNEAGAPVPGLAGQLPSAAAAC